MVVLGLCALVIQLWLRDRHRERIRFAEAHKWLVCHCTQSGTICVMKYKDDDSGYNYCPTCKATFRA